MARRPVGHAAAVPGGHAAAGGAAGADVGRAGVHHLRRARRRRSSSASATSACSRPTPSWRPPSATRWCSSCWRCRCASSGALGLALLLLRPRRGGGGYRAAVYVPTVIPDVAFALIWLWIFNPLFGPVNVALEALGLPAARLAGRRRDGALPLRDHGRLPDRGGLRGAAGSAARTVAGGTSTPAPSTAPDAGPRSAT